MSGNELFFEMKESGNTADSVNEGIQGDVISLNMTPVQQAAQIPLTSGTPKYSVPAYTPPEKIIVFDVETTGTNPWDYRLLVCSFWNLADPVSEIITFADWDEELLTQQIADYLNQEQPAIMICYNNGFDQRALLTRFMFYQIAVPGWNDIEHVDMMDVLKKGTTHKSVYSSQPAGSEEQWLMYFFGDEKPYTIEECFEGVREGDLTRMIVRNRACVASEGALYILFRSVTDSEYVEMDEQPTEANIDEAREVGICVVDCEICGIRNDFPCDEPQELCKVCKSPLPKPTEKNVLKEKVREFDYSKVGLKEEKTATKKTTTKK